ncbi:MAG: PEP-CTERM sorting domain-containing protein [Phycisphaerales bacterium]|nr:PEP-CTERM sorting domain-containing protein [Phycisphaerales bacterium]
MKVFSKFSVAALGMTALISAANGAITSVSGQTTWLGSPPVSCWPGALTGFNAYAWDEQQNITLATLAVDMTNNPGTSAFMIPGLLGGTYDSHFIHFEGIPGVISAQGTVTFATNIVGVIVKPLTLDNSDVTCGAFGTSYPTGYPLRGTNTSIPSFFSINANTITFNLAAIASIGEVAQIRVITDAVPAPGATALLGLGGLAMARRRRN